MKIAIAPASTRTSIATIRALLAQPSPSRITIKAFYRDTLKAPSEFTSRSDFEAVQGDVLDASTLDFAGCDAVLAIPPPFYMREDMVALSEAAAENTKRAVEKAGSVKRLVMLSSQGAHLYDGVGSIKAKTAAERILNKTSVPRITIIRPAYFMENWIKNLRPSPEPTMTSSITPLDWKIPMVAIKDIGIAAATSLTTTAEQSTQLHVCELHGPSEAGYSPLNARDTFSKRLGRKVKITGIEKDKLEGMFSAWLPAGCVPLFVEMAKCSLPGGVLDLNPDPEANVLRGETELYEVIAAEAPV